MTEIVMIEAKRNRRFGPRDVPSFIEFARDVLASVFADYNRPRRRAPEKRLKMGGYVQARRETQPEVQTMTTPNEPPAAPSQELLDALDALAGGESDHCLLATLLPSEVGLTPDTLAEWVAKVRAAWASSVEGYQPPTVVQRDPVFEDRAAPAVKPTVTDPVFEEDHPLAPALRQARVTEGVQSDPVFPEERKRTVWVLPA